MNLFRWFKDYMNGHPLRWLVWYLLLSLGGLFIFGMSVVTKHI